MKFLKLTGFGNGHSHLISLKSISDIAFEPNYTSITLNSGRSVNVTESETDIEKMINFSGGYIINENVLNNDLPF
jgi:uncharacterized protein YlzI (FlbEa/FlbD family)